MYFFNFLPIIFNCKNFVYFLYNTMLNMNILLVISYVKRHTDIYSGNVFRDVMGKGDERDLFTILFTIVN